MLPLIEASIVLAALGFGLLFPAAGARWFEVGERAFVALAEKRRLAVLTVALTALALRASVLPILPVPEPVINDEFSQLLAADTFAHGRLTNPTHPIWIHFETFQENQRPTYGSMYPPAQGLVLALGQVTTGSPFVGVWLSVGLMCAAICWMLQGWLSPPWALLGGLLAAMRFGVFSYWANSYFGGAIAAFGGALVLGALPRIKAQQRVGDAILLGLGLATLANSRPYEGLVFSLPVAVSLIVWLCSRNAPAFRRALSRVLLPLMLMLVVTALGMGYYFWRATGNPFLMPQHLNRETYAIVPYFRWQSLKPEPLYHFQTMRDFYRGEGVHYGQVLAGTLTAFFKLWLFYLGPLFTFPLFIWIARTAGPYGFSWAHVKQIMERIDPGVRFLIVTCIVFLIGLEVEVFCQPHYAAPITCLALALVLLAMRNARGWRWRNNPIGIWLTRVVPLLCVAVLVVRAASAPLHVPLGDWFLQAWYSQNKPGYGRAAVMAQLGAKDGKQLAIVRYNPGHDAMDEWVFNDADIDGAKVVWARDLGPARNAELAGYFKDRGLWLLEADERPPRLMPYIELSAPAPRPNQSPEAKVGSRF